MIRPTSETIIGDAFSRWVQSWRDLPLLINQWANVVRWEMRTRLFMRTAEFLWQEGHTVHATEEEAREETAQMLEVYRELAEEHLAMPVILGEKAEGERFPGAVNTYCIEAMMQDRKALQAGTSHYLGQNFSKAFNIRFNNKEATLEYGYTTSWGVTTRLIGALIMTHSDDDGLRLPPEIAPYHAVIIPILKSPNMRRSSCLCRTSLKQSLPHSFDGRPITCHIDKRDIRGGEKSWEWIKKGVPLRIEVGPRDVDNQACMVARRDLPLAKNELATEDSQIWRSCGIYPAKSSKATIIKSWKHQQEHTHTNITTLDELTAFFTPKNADKPEIHGGFVLAKWCGDAASEEKLADLK